MGVFILTALKSKSDRNENNLWIVYEDFCSLYDSGKVEGSPLHYHSKCELFLCVEGECKYFIDNKTYILKAGDMVFTTPKVLHKTNYNPKTSNSRYLIYCEDFLLPQSIQDLLPKVDYYVASVSKKLDDVELLFRKIHEEAEHRDAYSKDMIKSYLAAITVLFFRYSETAGSVQKRSKSSLVESAILYIKDNYSKNVTLESAAKHIASSGKYLSGAFKKETGINFNDYLTFYRLRQAESMLMMQPEKTILEIAYDCGFNNSSYFTSQFKKVYGFTPSQLRNGAKPENPRNMIFIP